VDDAAHPARPEYSRRHFRMMIGLHSCSTVPDQFFVYPYCSTYNSLNEGIMFY
jgi:hypothetical protein